MFSGRQKIALEEFKLLWKQDDKAWMEQRESHWHILERDAFQDIPKDKLEEYKNYFLKGECTDNDTECISQSYLFAFTPITTKEQASNLFHSKLFGAIEKCYLFKSHHRNGVLVEQGIPWIRPHMQYYIQGILGTEYESIESEYGKDIVNIAGHPKEWCVIFLLDGIDLLTDDEIHYRSPVDCIDYFISALSFSDKAKNLTLTKCKKLFRCVDVTLKMDKPKPVALEFAQKIKPREEEIKKVWASNPKL